MYIGVVSVGMSYVYAVCMLCLRWHIIVRMAYEVSAGVQLCVVCVCSLCAGAESCALWSLRV